MTTIRNDSLEVCAASLGAELQSIKSRDGLEYLWQGDPAFWPRRSPLLFPIVGSLPGGTFTYKGKSFKLGNHGFARAREFRLASSGADRMRFELESDADSMALYPFRFLLASTYRVEGSKLFVGWELENRSSEPMPFSIGAHPAFRAPLLPGEKREDYDFVFEKREKVSRHFLNEDNVRTGRVAPFLTGQDRLPLDKALFEPGAIVLIEHASRRLSLRSRVSGRFAELSFPGFPYLGIWSPKGDVPFVCIEPWHGVMPLADSSQELVAKEGCATLPPGASFQAEYSIVVG